MDIQGIYREVVGTEVERLEHLREGQVLPVSEDYHLVRLIHYLALDEAEQVYEAKV